MSENNKNPSKESQKKTLEKEKINEIAENNIFESNTTIEEDELSDSELHEHNRNLIEGALYASEKPLSIEQISMKLDISKKEVEQLLNELLNIYEDRSTSLTIVYVGSKYQMQIKPEYSEKLYQFAQGGAIAEKYLRTLTIIALKQPLLKSKLVKLRGSGAYKHVQYLEDHGIIDSVKKGRTSELTTTEKYAEMFGLPKNIGEMKKAMIEQLGIEPEPEPKPDSEK
jgi:segregation and condensation protein B